MPSGLPTAAQLLGKEITFFSMDTNVIQGAGYKFDAGKLGALALQRPPWLEVRLTEVVEREVAAHRMKPVIEALRQLQSASRDVSRVAGLDMSKVDAEIQAADIERGAANAFASQQKAFLRRLGGTVLPTDGPHLAKEMFARYFECQPPFEVRKKDEFPDAAALLVLEQHAKRNKTKGLLVSDDGGWRAFADQSDHLYCVKSLDDFKALFESTGPNTDELRSKISAALADTESPLNSALSDHMQDHLSNAYWDADDLYSGFNLRLEGEVFDSTISSYELDPDSLDPDSIGLWVVESDPTTCVVEFTVIAMVDVMVQVNFYQRDWVDGDDVNIGSNEVSRTAEVEVEVLLTCSADLLRDPVSEWDFHFEFATKRYSVSVGEVNPDLGYDEDYDPDQSYGKEAEGGR